MCDRALATVVVVEDDATVSHALETLLDAAGYRHQAFSSAEAMLGGALPPPPCCVLSDYRLPGMTGGELQARLARTAKYMPVLLLSGDANNEDIGEAFNNGAFAFMRKPFDPEELLACTERALEASRRCH